MKANALDLKNVKSFELLRCQMMRWNSSSLSLNWTIASVSKMFREKPIMQLVLSSRDIKQQGNIRVPMHTARICWKVLHLCLCGYLWNKHIKTCPSLRACGHAFVTLTITTECHEETLLLTHKPIIENKSL